jgi:hypothetical protein
MRASLALRAAAAAVVSVAAMGTSLAAQQQLAATTPVLAAAPAQWVGVYRLMFNEPSGAMLDARVIVEPAGSRITGMLIVDQHASGITAIRADGDALRAQIVAQEGRGELVLRNSGEAITGTLTIGKRVWQVSGQRAI